MRFEKKKPPRQVSIQIIIIEYYSKYVVWQAMTRMSIIKVKLGSGQDTMLILIHKHPKNSCFQAQYLRF